MRGRQTQRERGEDFCCVELRAVEQMVRERKCER